MTKKIVSLLIAAALLLAVLPSAAFARTAERAPVPAREEQVALWDLEEDPLENGWEFRDEDGDNNNWQWVNETYADNPLATSGEYSIRSRSYFGGGLNPDNWAVSPEVELPEAESIVMSCMVASYLGNYPETFRFYAFVDGSDEPVALGEDMQSPTTSRVFEEFTADLSEYAGQSVRVAVRHYNCYDQYMMYVDDIAIVADPENDTPVDPTEPPVDPTDPPVDPTDPPAPDGLIAGYYFEGGNDGWTFNGTANTNWVHSDNNPSGYPYASLAHEGSGFIVSYSYVDYVGAYQADNWAISPAVTLPAGSASVSFYATNANASYPEAFDVYIGTSAETSAMTLLQGNISPSSGYEDEWTNYEIDLSDYAGQTIYLAFYDHCYDMYEIWIDQVEFFGEGGDPTDPPVDPTHPPVDPTTPPVVDDHKIVGYYFETDPEEEGWEFIDQDGDGNNWEWMPNVSYYAYEGHGSIDSNSYLNGAALTPDNWAISPEIELRDENNSVTFFAFGRGGEDYGYEHFAVYAGADFDSMVEVLPEEVTELSYIMYTVNLDDFANETVCIAIRHFNCTDMYAINVDQFEVWGDDSDVEEPTVIDTVEILDFVEPAWGENPFYGVTVPENAGYSIVYTDWNWYLPDSEEEDILPETDVFDNEEYVYYQYFALEAEEGFEFAEEVTVHINGSEELVDFVQVSDSVLTVWSIDFTVEEPPALPTLDEALNIEGGELHFESEGAYPWIVVTDTENDRIFAMSSNGGVASTDSIVTTTFTANAGDVVKFEYKAFGEGTNTYWDYCEFSIDGVRAGYWGAQQNDWELFTSEPLTAGEHTLTWKYHKDSSVNPNGDYFAVDNVEIAEGELPATGILGDTDMNGEVTTADALLALRYIMGLVDFTDEQIEQAEVTGEGEVSIADSLLILRKAMGLIETFPAEEP